MKFTLTADIIGLTLSTTFLLLFLISENRSNRARYLLVAGMAAAVFLFLLNTLVVLEEYSAATIAFILAFPMLYAIYPIINSYINSLVSGGEKIEIKLKNYFVPIFVFVSILILILFMHQTEINLLVSSLNSYKSGFPLALDIFVWTLYIIYYLQFLYFTWKFYTVYQTLQNDSEFSFVAKWIKYIIYGVFIYEITFFITWFIKDDILLLDALFGDLIILLFGIIGIKHDEILLELKLSKVFEKIPVSENKRKIKSKFETDSQKEIVSQIKEIIVSEKLFLNPRLQIKSFAKRLHLPEKELSIIINDFLGKNFSSFVNDFRIEEARKLLLNKELKVSAIPTMVGFYSRSAFNTTFKEITGLTPTEYRSTV